MSKILITGGCSFSECISVHIDTWPRHLARCLSGYHHIATAMGSQGNGLISRKIIYAIANHLDHDLLVGIVWSGPDRHDFYLDQPPELENNSGWMQNPTAVNPDSQGGWVVLNHQWSMPLAKTYYTHFHDRIAHLIYS